MHGVGLIYNNTNENLGGEILFIFSFILIYDTIKLPVTFLSPSADKRGYPQLVCRNEKGITTPSPLGMFEVFMSYPLQQ